jgi:hypothetical protein
MQQQKISIKPLGHLECFAHNALVNGIGMAVVGHGRGGIVGSAQGSGCMIDPQQAKFMGSLSKAIVVPLVGR